MNSSYYLATQHHLRTGDLLKSPKSFFDLIQHHAIFWGYWNGHAWMAENREGHGVVYTRFDDYLARVGRINSIVRYTGTEWDRQQVQQHAHERIGWPYDKWNYNCEQFANEVLHGQRHSQQAETVKGVLKGALVLGLLAGIVRAA